MRHQAYNLGRASKARTIPQNVCRLMDYYKERAEWMNRFAEENDLPFSFFVDDLENTVKEILKSPIGSRFLESNVELIYRETIENAMRIVRNMLDGTPVAVIGATQSGKTATIAASAYFLAPMMYLLNGRPSMPLIWLPNKHSDEMQSKSKCQSFCEINKVFSIQSKDGQEPVHIGNYFSDTSDTFSKRICDSKYQYVIGRKVLQGFLSLGGSSLAFLRRTNAQASVKLLKSLIFISIENDFSMPIFLDEAHLGMREGSTTDGFLRGDLQEYRDNLEASETDNLLVRTLYETINSTKSADLKNFPRCSVSATNFGFGQEPAAALVFARIPRVPNKPYCGLPFYWGSVIDPQAVEDGYVIFPEVHSLSEVDCMIYDGEKNGIALLDPKAFYSTETWLWYNLLAWGLVKGEAKGNWGNQIDRRNRSMYTKMTAELEVATTVKQQKRIVKKWAANPKIQAEHCQYRLKSIDAIVDLVCWLLVKANPKKQNGVIFRWTSDNKKTEQLTDILMMKLAGKIDVMCYYDGIKESPMEFINTRRTNRPYVVFVTGHARCQESYPEDCSYGIDLSTRTASTISSHQQGVLGRTTGVGKRAFVILQDELTNWHNDVFVRLKGAVQDKSPCPATAVLSRQNSYPTIFLDLKRIPQRSTLRNDLLRYERDLRSIVKKHGSRYVKSKQILIDVFDYFRPQSIEEIETNPSLFDPKFDRMAQIELLRKNVNDMCERRYQLDPKTGKILYAMRVFKNGAESAHHGVVGDRANASDYKEWGGHYAIHNHYCENGKTFDLLALTLRVRGTTFTGLPEIVSDANSVYHNFGNNSHHEAKR